MERLPRESRASRTVPRPLKTSLGLLAVGVVTLGGALLLLPRAANRPVSVHMGELESAPGASPTARVVSTTGPGTEGGSIGASSTGSAASEGRDLAAAAGSSSAAGAAASASASSGSSVAVAPVAVPVGGVAGVIGAPAASIDPRTPPSAIGGGPRAGGQAADAGAAAPSVAAGDAGAGGVGGGADGGSAGYYGVPLAAPVYGAPPASTSTGGPVTSGAAGDAAPLWTGSFGGGGSGGNGAIVNPRPAIAKSFLVSMSDGQDPESTWTSLSPYLRPSDVIVVRLAGDGPNRVAYQDFGDRVRIDAPLVGYMLAFSDVANLRAMITRGLPATVSGVGPAQTDALDAESLVSLSAAVHGSGRRFFVSTSPAPKVPLGELGARADVIELVVDGASTESALDETLAAVMALRSAGRPTIFVRLPGAATLSASAASTFLSGLDGRMSGLGASIPYGTSTGFLGDLRASP